MFPPPQIAHSVLCIAAATAIAGCATAPSPHMTAAVAELRDRAAVCAKFSDMDVPTQADAVRRLRGVDAYRCDQLERQAGDLLRDPVTNALGDMETKDFLNGLAFPQGQD